jgi:hypothetical protein
VGFVVKTFGNGRSVGISLLIASLIHIPLPQPDFHNIRHHDAPGEVCVYHDHLLRWHPSAGRNADTSILHWHWVLPALDGFGEDGQSSDDGQPPRHGSGPAFHAHVGDGLEPDWSTAQWLSADGSSASLERVTNPLADSHFDFAGSMSFEARPPGPCFGRSSVPSPARSAPRSSLQRWNC